MRLIAAAGRSFLALLAAAPTGCTTAAPPAPPSTAQTQKAWALQCKDADDWDRPGPPFRIWGNSWYVGTCGIAAILVTGDKGHILIDGGTAKGGALIARNIAAAGFRPGDVKLLLMSHEHHDHAGGLAELQRLTGAGLLASPKAGQVMQGGGMPDAEDPQAGSLDGFPAARVDGFIADGEPVQYGPISLMPHLTPGHTPGAVTWQWPSCEGEDCRTIVYADSLSPVSAGGYRFSDHPEYVASFRRSLDRLAGMKCDILLAPHPFAARMRARMIVENGLHDRNGCRDYAQAMRQRLDARLTEEIAERR